MLGRPDDADNCAVAYDQFEQITGAAGWILGHLFKYGMAASLASLRPADGRGARLHTIFTALFLQRDFWGGFQQAAGVWVLGSLRDLPAGSHLHNLAAIHDRDAG